jgi:hypothetical protein
MGLDWMVQPKDRAGMETVAAECTNAFAEVEKKINALYRSIPELNGEDPPTQEAITRWLEHPGRRVFIDVQLGLRNRLTESTVSPCETIGAPRVGVDPAATEWCREQYQEYCGYLEARRDTLGVDTLEEFMANSHGRYVVDLVPRPHPGVAAYCGVAGSSLDFRGKMLRHCGSILSDELMDEAYKSHTAEELEDYGHRLLEAHESAKLSVDEEERNIRHIVKSAGEWCVYWGSNGHSMYAWY